MNVQLKEYNWNWSFEIELIAPTTVKTTEHYMENGRKTKDSQMVGDYGVEEWRDGGKFYLHYSNRNLYYG